VFWVILGIVLLVVVNFLGQIVIFVNFYFPFRFVGGLFGIVIGLWSLSILFSRIMRLCRCLCC
jgi:uncharacterized membrane protein